MGLWGAIKKSINSDLTKPLNTLIDNVQSTVTTINTNTARGVIKSVQRGTSSISPNTSSSTTINISSVTPSKCSVNVYGAGVKYGSITDTSYRESAVYVTDLSSTTLTFTASGSVSTTSSGHAGYFGWEVVEFY